MGMREDEVIDWNLIPKTRARTSYALMEDVIRVIQEEPRRIYMPDWVVIPENATGRLADGLISRFPSCGTVGCIAGWMGLLHGQSNGSNWTAQLWLPVKTRPDAYSLFMGLPPYPFPTANHGTPEYARDVIKNICTFMASWEKELKSYTLERN